MSLFGFSMNKPPMFINHEFFHWKNFMTTYLMSIDYDMGCFIEENDFGIYDLNRNYLNVKVLNIIQEALVGSKYDCLTSYTCAKKLWNYLERCEEHGGMIIEDEEDTYLEVSTSNHNDNNEVNENSSFCDYDLNTCDKFEEIKHNFEKMCKLVSKVIKKNNALKSENIDLQNKSLLFKDQNDVLKSENNDLKNKSLVLKDINDLLSKEINDLRNTTCPTYCGVTNDVKNFQETPLNEFVLENEKLENDRRVMEARTAPPCLLPYSTRQTRKFKNEIVLPNGRVAYHKSLSFDERNVKKRKRLSYSSKSRFDYANVIDKQKCKKRNVYNIVNYNDYIYSNDLYYKRFDLKRKPSCNQHTHHKRYRIVTK